MSDIAIFMFGFLATSMAVGPLFIAMIADLREDKEKQNK